MKKIVTCTIALLSAMMFISCVTKTVLVKCPTSGATIKVDGDFAGHQEATFKVKFTGWKSVVVSAPHYLTQKFTMRGGTGENYREVCLEEDPEYSQRTYIIKTTPEDASISVGGNTVAQGSYSFSMDKMHYLLADVSRQGYFSSTIRIDGTDNPGVVNVVLVEDDAWTASAPASDIANKNIRFRATCDKSDDEIWYTLIRYASFSEYRRNTSPSFAS